MQRTSGRNTVGLVAAVWPGWVRVEVDPGGSSKDVPEGEVYRLLGGLRLASADSLLWAQGSAPSGGPAHFGGPARAPYGGPALAPRTVALGQDAVGLPAEAGLTHADFSVGEPVGPVPNMTSPSFNCHHTLCHNPPDIS